jgi:hypothetical protein
MIRYTEELLGKMVIKQNENEFEIEIRRGNCLAVFIFVDRDDNENVFHTLYNFFADTKHIKQIAKNRNGDIFGHKVTKLSLNMYYEESYKLLKQLVKYYNIECYYGNK